WAGRVVWLHHGKTMPQAQFLALTPCTTTACCDADRRWSTLGVRVRADAGHAAWPESFDETVALMAEVSGTVRCVGTGGRTWWDCMGRLRNPPVVHGLLEDYRAGLRRDRPHEEAART